MKFGNKLIMSREGNGTPDLRGPEKEKESGTLNLKWREYFFPPPNN